MRKAGLVAVLLALSPWLVAAPARAQLSGTVRAMDGTPLQDAIVRLQATDVSTTTATDGTFDLPGATGTGLRVVGGAVGYFYGAVTVDAPSTTVDLALEPVPITDEAGASLPRPQMCGRCHEEQLEQWRGSAMGHAGTNTWVYDIYDGSGTANGMGGFVYTRDSVHYADNPASECASCHEPSAWVVSPGAAMLPIDSGDAAVEDGVSCGACHMVRSVDDARPNYPGLHPDSVSLARPDATWAVQYGVLGDVDYVSPAEMRGSYQPQLRAAVCGTCHQDKNDPDGDGDFEEDDGVISEPTYVEWLDSPYSDPSSEHYATCVDCHMAPTGSPTACNQLDGAFTRPSGHVRSHVFEGTTAQYLENAASVSIDARLEGDRILADVTVVNDQTGHHVPTGVTIRNVILLVEAFRTQDGESLRSVGTQLVHALGGVGDPAQGYYADQPGKLYAKVNQAADGSSPTFFTDATSIAFDTRIPALGSDVTSYAFEVPDDGGDLRVRARLIYRRSWRALVDAKRWRSDGHGRPLTDIQGPHYGHLMDEAMSEVLSLPYTPPMFDASAGADGGADAGTGAGGGGCDCRAVQAPALGGIGWLGLALGALLIFGRRRR